MGQTWRHGHRKEKADMADRLSGEGSPSPTGSRESLDGIFQNQLTRRQTLRRPHMGG